MTKSTENSSQTKSFPKYNNPPINEVACGVRFDAPDELKIPHIGFLWEKFRDEYPVLQHVPPIASTKGEILVDPATGVPLPRVWFINESDDQLVQFQIDRLYFNWRRRQNDYPRYDHVIKQFESVWMIVETFFNDFNLGRLKPLECELTYINHIPKGEGWNSIDDISQIFPDFIWKQTKDRFLPNPEKLTWNAEFLLPEEMGHLGISLKQAIRTDDKTPLLVLELKTLGICNTETLKDIREWFDTAHKWIVQGFTDITTPEVQRIWERN